MKDNCDANVCYYEGFFFYTIAVRLQNNYCTKAKLAFSTVEHDQFPIER